MKLGKILFYDHIGREGLLESRDGSYYEFNSESLAEGYIPLKGELVDFNPIEIQGMYLSDHVRVSLKDLNPWEISA
jgi:hypothetical protein